MTRATVLSVRWYAALIVGAAWLLMAPLSAHAQENTPPKLYYSYRLNADLADLKSGDSLSLRPNVKLPLYLYLENQLKADVEYTVQLARVTKSGPVPFVSAKVTLPKKKEDNSTTKQVLSGWTVAGAPVKPPVVGAPPVPPPAAPELEMPFAVELQVLEDGKLLISYKLGVTLDAPDKYLQAESPKYDDKTREFSVTLVSRKLPGKTAPADTLIPLIPPCDVLLDLDNSPHPLLVKPIPKTSARLLGQLTPKIDKVVLRAGALQFEGATRKGPVWITADGVERSFIFMTEFAGVPTPFTDKIIRLGIDNYVKAADELRVRLETDNIDWTTHKLWAAMDSDGDGVFSESERMSFPTTRQLRVQLLPPAEDGALVMQTLVKDWEAVFATKGMFGKVALEAWVEDSEGKKLPFAGKPVETKRTIILDGTAPEKIKFEELSKTYPFGKIFSVAASGVDPESDIKEVWFGVAPVIGDVKWKKDAIRGTKDPKRKNVWVAEFDPGLDLRGPLELGVLFVNGANMTEIVTQKLSLIDPKSGGPTGKKLATINVVVREGELEQNGLEVTLLDKDGKEVKKEKTDTVKDAKGKIQRGQAVFKDLEPGKYTAVSSKSASNTVGRVTVDVKDGETKAADIKLFRP